MPRPDVHPSALVSPDARLAPGVTVGPFAVIDGPVDLGPGCVVRGHAQLLGRVSAGIDNDFGAGCVVGERPQHLGYKGEDTAVRIGDGNCFREHVTVHRAMPTGTGETVIGNRNLFMAGSHVAHDCVVGDHCIFVNAAVIGGHAHIGDRVLLSGHTAVHQFCRVGRLALLSGVAGASLDVPPFWIIRSINLVCGVNVIGMRRAGMPTPEILAVRKAFRLIYLSKLTVSEAVAEMEQQFAGFAAVRELAAFIRTSKRGIPGGHMYRPDADAAAA
jgi:UDP-N-acetylglucosamine acyltransferase